MIKKRIKKFAIPTKLVITPFAEKKGLENLGSYKEINCFITIDGKYRSFSFKAKELYKKTNKNKIKGEVKTTNGCFSVYHNITVDTKDILFFSFKNDYAEITAEDDILNEKKLYNGKIYYFDQVNCCGQDFNYEQPYYIYVRQPKFNSEHQRIREKFADSPVLTFYVDELDNDLYKSIQELAVKKFKATNDYVFGDKNKICWQKHKIIEEIPIELYNGEIHFRNHISFKAQEYHKKFLIKVPDGGFPDYFYPLYGRTMGFRIQNIKKADEILSEFYVYVNKILPKLKYY